MGPRSPRPRSGACGWTPYAATLDKPHVKAGDSGTGGLAPMPTARREVLAQACCRPAPLGPLGGGSPQSRAHRLRAGLWPGFVLIVVTESPLSASQSPFESGIRGRSESQAAVLCSLPPALPGAWPQLSPVLQGPLQSLPPLHGALQTDAEAVVWVPASRDPGTTGRTAGTHTSSQAGGCTDIILTPPRKQSLSTCYVPGTALSAGTEDTLLPPEVQQCGGRSKRARLSQRGGD